MSGLNPENQSGNKVSCFDFMCFIPDLYQSNGSRRTDPGGSKKFD